MNANTHRYCDFDADRNCIFFFGADDDEEELNSSQWVAADENDIDNRRFPYINVFAKARFKTNEIKCKLVPSNINHHQHQTEKNPQQTFTKQSIVSNQSIAKTPSPPLNLPPSKSGVVTTKISHKSPTILPKTPLVHNPAPAPQQIHIITHCAQFPAYSNLSDKLQVVNPSPPQPRTLPLPHHQLVQSKMMQAQQAQVHHIMAQYEQRGQKLAQQRAQVEKEIVQRIQCIEELETKLSQQRHKTAVTTTYPYYYAPILAFSNLKVAAGPIRTRPVVRLPQEYMVNNLKSAYSTIGGQQILIGMANDSHIYQRQQQRQR